MNFFNNLLIVTGAGVTRAGIKAGTRSGPEVGLRDGAGEVLPK